jgi:hypothetical protein
MSIAGALAAAGLITGYEVPVAHVQAAQAAAERTGVEAKWLDVALLGGAGVFFLISAIRLIRRTQGFWTWLLGFACYGGRWAFAHEGELLQLANAIDPHRYLQPQAIVADTASPEAQVGLLAIMLIVGLITMIVDAVDRAYWDRQDA